MDLLLMENNSWMSLAHDLTSFRPISFAYSKRSGCLNKFSIMKLPSFIARRNIGYHSTLMFTTTFLPFWNRTERLEEQSSSTCFKPTAKFEKRPEVPLINTALRPLLIKHTALMVTKPIWKKVSPEHSQV